VNRNIDMKSRIRRAVLGTVAVSVLFVASACASSGGNTATVGARVAPSSPASSGSLSPPAPSGPSSSSAAMVVVEVQNLAFTPQTVTIPAGGTVMWKFDDTIQHTVTAQDQSFDSGPMSGGQTFVRTFPKAGTYAYMCTIHPFMTGTVVVK
jgi:plastocyanin